MQTDEKLQIDEKLIEYLEELSYLTLSDEEKLRLTGDLRDILTGIDRLGELDTEGIIECSHPFDNVNSFRNDEVLDSFDRNLILQNAPESNDTMIVAPKTVE